MSSIRRPVDLTQVPAVPPAWVDEHLYTALRGPRPKGIDIVKAEHEDLTQLDALAKRTDSALLTCTITAKAAQASTGHSRPPARSRCPWRRKPRSLCRGSPMSTSPRRNALCGFAGDIWRTLRWFSGSAKRDSITNM